MQYLLNIYGITGLILLILSSLSWSLSHFIFVKGEHNTDYIVRIFGFILLVLIFIVSGLKAGLLALPIILIFSFISAGISATMKNN
ncbi:MAG: hypothetical protein PHP62_04785 [Candidatus Moranbacteria bacterium]|nr:hypothetical protein [Candidatus Moranbacteria bacterium]